ncbi:transcriptional regulator GlxA family with amidase domain [Thermocatellispora tengchongensis]|uniref:Transcriptional regulator GlxA family with amidase domain n=1 Tax=Thermocatellispora tengchongensis TaxID=1073253 RepID=A0A840P088_9ACTN|nr:DJ-1/PfpI family protein [Thermocatellispora tengchongensis]MBB5131321.1 transcriptional regulator GlxA family with amidase domain [Thermocatellispora tengchongensis]
MTTYGLLLFDGAEELDFTGPWEVFTVSAMVRQKTGASDRAVLIAERPDPVRCAKGMRVLPDHTLADHPPLDVVLVPGGVGTRREVDNPVVIEWLAKTAAAAQWVTSVCTGALLLHQAGPARGRRVATHYSFEDTLEARGEVTVVRDARYVVDGSLVTSQGVSAGIDMALWLVGRLHGRDHARAVRRYIQYEPAPPYLADEPLPGAS